tara:strand:+ start:6401 stop:7255 length:855 start_codon:yes stop_codon:yes gene_type:complete
MEPIRLGSAFSGIGGFELGLHWSIPNLETVWQVEKNPFCRRVLAKHWPNAQRFDDIKTISSPDLETIDILAAGFPCQNLSIAGKREGIHAEKSGLFWELWRLLREFRDDGRAVPIVLLENVSAITFSGIGHVLGALSKIGYNVEWFDLRASDFGAPHRRERIFFVCYRADHNRQSNPDRAKHAETLERATTYSFGTYSKKHPVDDLSMEPTKRFKCRGSKNKRVYERYNWKRFPIESPLCSRNDGISDRLARLTVLGNAIVPQCSEWIGQRLIDTGLLSDILGR